MIHRHTERHGRRERRGGRGVHTAGQLLLLGLLALATGLPCAAQPPAQDDLGQVRPPAAEGGGRGMRRGAGGPFIEGGQRGMRRGPAGPIPAELPAELRLRWDQMDGARWVNASLMIENMIRNFERLESERGRLLSEMEAAKRGYEQGVMDPSMVLRRQQVERLLGSLHENINEGRMLELQGGELLRAIERNKAHVRELLGQVPPGPLRNPPVQRRQDRWLQALNFLEAGERERWANLLLGPILGPLALRAGEQDEGAIMEEPGPPRGALTEQIRRQLQRRQRQIDDLETRQQELETTVQRQGQEIDSLRRLLEARFGDTATTGTARPG